MSIYVEQSLRSYLLYHLSIVTNNWITLNRRIITSVAHSGRKMSTFLVPAGVTPQLNAQLTDHPTQITLKSGASAEELEKYVLHSHPHPKTLCTLADLIATRAKQTAVDQGGKITHESKLIKSIT